MNLQELRQKRLKWVEANRENGFDDGIKRLLTDLYPDNAHFIYELLQNAEDARASEVRFILKEDSVEFEHNGDRLFSIKDVESITSIGISTKKDDPTNIGKFGVGFKAVFAYTSTPEIKSGEYHFRIRDLVVPDTKGLSLGEREKKKTCFVFPFDNPGKSPEMARVEIERNLRQLNESSLLFLSNIKKIEYLLPDSTLGFLERREIDENRIEILVQHPGDSEPASVVFLRFEKRVDVNDEDDNLKTCRIAVAFGLEKTQGQEWKIKLLDRGQVCIYFPAEKETSNLHFHLHAPFASTVARDSVRDCEANDDLRDQLADLIAESIAIICDQRLLTVGFLATLPNDRDNLSSFYKSILNRLIEVFKNKELVPMKQGGHAAANNIFRGSAQLSDLINDSDLVTILEEDYYPPMWIANPPQRNQREYNFLSMLDIPEWTPEDLVNELSAKSETIMKWLAEKPNEWHQRLYALLGEFLSNAPLYPRYAATERKDKLSKLRIIRCSDGEYRVGSECYFPSDGAEFDKLMPRVTKGVYSSGENKQEQEKAHKFLEDIGVREVGEVEQVEAILKNRYSQAAVDRKNFRPEIKDIKRFIDLIKKDPSQGDLFKDYFIFNLTHGKWGKPGQVYLDSPFYTTGLSAYYDALEDKVQRWALSENYKKCGISLEKIGEFGKKVGAQTKLKPKEQEIPYGHPERSGLNDSGRWTHHGIDKDYDIQELDVLFIDPNLSMSKLIWDTMNTLPDRFLVASYRSNSRYSVKTAYSTLVHELKENKWVPQESEEKSILFVRPQDAVVDKLPKGFPYEKGRKWLESISFGESVWREESERLEAQEQTDEVQQRETIAKDLGFDSIEEAEEMIELKRSDPDGFKRWQESNKKDRKGRDRKKGGHKKEKPHFPIRQLKNPERRRARVAEQLRDAPEKEYKPRERSDRTTRVIIESSQQLREQYTNDSDQMICQICKGEMPFKKRDKEYYFEAVEALSRDYFPREHEAQFLALCPECAARYKEFIKRDETAMKNLYHAMKNSDVLEVPLKLGELETSLQFVETHWQGMKTILQIPIVDQSDTWSEQDQKDLTTASLKYAATLYPEEEEDLV